MTLLSTANQLLIVPTDVAIEFDITWQTDEPRTAIA
jgi:hypothetical protein